MFQLIFRYFKKIGNSKNISVWKPKGLSGESIKPPSSNKSPPPVLNYISGKIRVKIDTIVSIYIAHEIDLWPFKQSTDFALENSLFRAPRLTKMLILIN